MKILLVLLQVLLLSGAGTAEEMDETEMEHFDCLASNPVPVNIASENRLHACGLFSNYQIASLREYIRTNGDILSATELGTVAGFTPELAAAMRPYLSFESYSRSTAPRSRRLRQGLTLRYAKGSPAGKYRIQYGDIAEFHLSSRDRTLASLAVHGKRPWKIVAGNYNARLGQGLMLWSGFSMSGVPLSTAFCKNASGFSPSSSFTPSFTGIAADYCDGTLRGGAALNADGTAIASAGWMGRSASAGANFIHSKGLAGISSDATMNIGHCCLFAEAAFSGAPAGIAGIYWAPAYGASCSFLVRYFSPGYSAGHAGAVRTGSKVRDEAGASAAAQWKWLAASFDWALHPERLENRKNNYQQIKSVVDAQPSFNFLRWEFAARLRWEEKMALSPSEDGAVQEWRHYLRTGMKVSRKGFSTAARVDYAVAGSLPHKGWLGSIEAGYKTPSSNPSALRLSVFLRATSCSTSAWASRIYMYERDIPGSFSVRAWYGNSCGAALVCGLACRKWKYRHSLDLAAAFRKSDSGTGKGRHTELKIQYGLSL